MKKINITQNEIADFFDNTIALYDDLNLQNKKCNFIGNKKSNPKEILKKFIKKVNNAHSLWNN